MATKSFKPQNLRTLLSILFAVVVLGGGVIFYFGLEMVRGYAVEVNNRLKDADASELDLQRLRTLKNKLEQNQSLIATADRLFTSEEAYQAQVSNDLRNYANQVGIAITATDFDPEPGSHTVIVKLAKPTSYSKFVQFLKLVEGNLPKLEILTIDLKRVNNGSADSVEAGDITIKTSVR